MEMPTVVASRLIEKGKFSWIDNVYQGHVPIEVQDDSDTTDIVVSEWLNEPAGYANQIFKRWTIGVEVQLFFKLADQTTNLIESEIAIAELFKKDGWIIEQSKNNIKDADTGQMSKVFLFSKILNLKEGK